MPETNSDNEDIAPLPSAIKQSAQPIKRLSKDVVDRIAAGEIIHKPSSALKEMLENSVDAGSTSISVSCKEGGIKLLQVSDNGKGIRKEDLGIVCERHTTSKIQKFEDLTSVTTYGFRGEALASISMVANLTIVTKTRDADCAHRATYEDSKLKSEPQPCAGVQGTTIMVKDLFYNVPTRLRTMKSANEEYRSVLNVVSKYAIHYGDNGVGFTCKNLNLSNRSKMADVNTTSKNTSLDNIRSIYGNKIAKELLKFEISSTLEPLDPRVSDIAENSDACTGFKYKAKGYISNANWSNRSGHFILFINHRLVDHPPLKKAVNSVYTEYLPRHGKPFIYLSLELPPQEVDVNVHPTKKEVIFSRSDEIVGDICIGLRTKLKDGNQSRVFQTVNPSAIFQSVTTASTSIASSSSDKTIEKSKENHAAPSPSSLDKTPHTSSSGSDFEASLESFKRKATQSKRNGGNDASGAFTMPVSKKKKVSKAYDPKRLNRTDYSNPAGILDAYLTKGNVSNNKNVIQRGNKALQGKTKKPENISTSTATIATNNQPQPQVSRTVSSRKTYPHPSNIRRKKKKKRLKSGVNDSDGNYLDDSDSDSDELTSVLNMRKDVKLEYHKGLGSVLKEACVCRNS